MKNTTKWFFRNKHAVFFIVLSNVQTVNRDKEPFVNWRIDREQQVQEKPYEMAKRNKEMQSYLQQGTFDSTEIVTQCYIAIHLTLQFAFYFCFNILFIDRSLNKFLPSFMCFENMLFLGLIKSENMLRLSTQTLVRTEPCVDNMSKDRSDVFFDTLHVC